MLLDIFSPNLKLLLKHISFASFFPFLYHHCTYIVNCKDDELEVIFKNKKHLANMQGYFCTPLKKSG